MATLKYWFPHAAHESPVLRVNGIGIREPMRPGLVHRPRGTGDHLLMFFPDPVRIETGGRSLRQAGAAAMLWDDGRGHCYGDPDGPWGHSWIHAKGSLVRELVLACDLPFDQPFAIAGLEGIDLALCHLYDELVNPAADEVIAHNLFHCLLREIRRARPENAPARPVPPGILEVKAYLDAHFTHTVTLADLARRARLSIPHFCSEFKRCYGSSAVEYTIARRLQLAAYYLRDRNLRVREVAERVGYSDLCYFSRLFKRRFGRSPRQLREQGHAAAPEARAGTADEGIAGRRALRESERGARRPGRRRG